MKIGLVDVDGHNFPNVALMKIASWHRQQGDTVEWVNGFADLMRADERIKDLVNKIIHKQVENAYQEEYLVDTTTRYIAL